jgi:hypothetical protein
MSQETKPADSVQIPVDESHIVATYANFCRVIGTPEELIIDFGLNKQVGDRATDTIQLTQRIILNFFTAKRLAYALGMAVQRHEQAFGTLEVDVQKRVVARRQPAGAGV